jgi:hypothetical protein
MGFRSRRGALEKKYMAGVDTSGAAAATAGAGYMAGAQGFDAQSGANMAAMGQFQTFLPQLKRAIAEMRGEQVGMGRLKTGYGNEDEDYLVGQSLNNLNAQVAQRAMQAQGMNLQNIQGMGQYASEQQGQHFDLISGGLDRAVAEENERRKRRAGLWGGLAKIAGGVAGSVLGPVGSALGAKLAGSLVN